MMDFKKITFAAVILVLCISISGLIRGQESDESKMQYRFPVAFVYSTAIGPEPDVARRDPSDVIKVGSKYYVWYTKVYATEQDKFGDPKSVFPTGYPGTIWYATSTDGKTWIEQGEALGRGKAGAWDEHGVFTPGILEAEERYYLFYNGVDKHFSNEFDTTATPHGTGLAISDSPDGPWQRYRPDDPVMKPGNLGEWDDFRIADPCLIVRNNKYWLFYKGLDHKRRITPMGVAIADKPVGPYVRSKYNPLILPGHEVLIWHHGDGLAALVWKDGIWYASDGIHFERHFSIPISEIPSAPGAYRPGDGITWGISQKYLEDRSSVYLQRFDCIFNDQKQ